ncbi:MAG: ABC transporter permease [Pyrinomonadaceae bacterium]|nr:ABC transporter permease [Pyrinomonadaceae bacterium]
MSDITSGQIGDALPDASRERRVTLIRPPALSLGGVLRDFAKLSHYRDLLYTLSVHRVKVRYKQSVLGVAWAVLQPLSLMLIYTLIFSYIARMPSDGIPYAVFAYSALLPWTYFSTALVNSTNGLVSHADLVTKVYFPREILPVTYVIAALFDFLVASIVFAGLLIYYNVQLTWVALYSFPIILVLTFFATAMSLLFSATQVRFRDIGVAMPLLMQLWMFASPVVYPLSAVPKWLRPFYMLNPMAGIIESFRRVMLQREPPDFTSLGVALILSLVLLAVSYIYFKRVEATIADVI